MRARVLPTSRSTLATSSSRAASSREQRSEERREQAWATSKEVQGNEALRAPAAALLWQLDCRSNAMAFAETKRARADGHPQGEQLTAPRSCPWASPCQACTPAEQRAWPLNCPPTLIPAPWLVAPAAACPALTCICHAAALPLHRRRDLRQQRLHLLRRLHDLRAQQLALTSSLAQLVTELRGLVS